METYFKEARLLRDINRALDGDYQKLSDKYKNLELSHNRKKKALEELRELFKCMLGLGRTSPNMYFHLFYTDVFQILKVIDNALFCDGRERSKK